MNELFLFIITALSKESTLHNKSDSNHNKKFNNLYIFSKVNITENCENLILHGCIYRRGGGGIMIKNHRSLRKFSHWFFGPFGEENSRRLGV